MTFRIILGIVLGGMLGRSAAEVCLGFANGTDLARVFAFPLEYLTSILILVVLPALFRGMTVGWAIFLGVLWCSILGLVASAVLFDTGGLELPPAFGFELIYGIVATLVFAICAADPLQARREFRAQ